MKKFKDYDDLKDDKIKDNKDKKKSSKKIIIFGVIILSIIVITTFGILYATSFERKIEKLINSGKTEVLFFDRGDSKSRDVKSVLDYELKEQGINSYTVIDVWNLSSKEKDFLVEKNILSDNVVLYLKVINGSENITSVSSDEANRDTIMYYFAREDLLNDNQKFVNEHFYSLGKIAYNEGFLGIAKENLEKCRGYLDTDEILSNYRFLLLNSEYEYRVENISMYGYNLIFSVKYYGSYNSDTFMIYKFECQGAYNCLLTEGESTFYDAKVVDNKIYIKDKNESSYNKYYTIEKLTDNQLKLEQMNFTMTKN